MIKKHRWVFLVLLLAGLALLAIRYLRDSNLAVLNPKGVVAAKERNLIVFALSLSLVVVIPVFGLLFTFAWRYRESNTKAKYSPNLDGNLAAETTWWLIPTILISILSVVAWKSSHTLDPYKPLSSSTRPITIQVVAMDWKWLFIYPDPEQNIASVNYVQFPVSTPVNFEITSDAPMNSFWIPQLGGQIYAMPGMSTELHLMANQTGNFRGSSANISGQGFAGMDFTAKATSQAAFRQWVESVKYSPSYPSLNLGEYNKLAKPSENNPATYYSSAGQGTYNNAVMRFMMPGMQGYVQ